MNPARGRAQDPVSGQHVPIHDVPTMKSPRKRAKDLRKLSANEMQQEATTCTSGGVNMDRFFLFLVLHDDDPATQEGKIISTNLLVI